MRKKALFLLFFGCGLVLLGCTVNEATLHSSEPEGTVDNAFAQVEEKSVARKDDVPINDFYLPLQNSKVRTEEVTHVMIHFISNSGENPHDPHNVDEVYSIFTEYGISAHYMIGRNGEIYQLVDEDRVAFHAGKGSLPGYPEYQDKMNEHSIGIELLALGTRDEMLTMISGETYDSIDPSHIGYTDSQYYSLNLLLDDIYKRNPSVIKDRKHVVGHDEYALGRKTDPGSLFDWTKIGF
jgi:N-acetyl-anhydromuramyl-L-alanine amidase AmpD